MEYTSVHVGQTPHTQFVSSQNVMFGQGSPPKRKPVVAIRLLLTTAFTCLLFTHPLHGDESASGMRLRFSFGGTDAAVWKGKISLPDRVKPRSLRILGMQSDHVGRIYSKDKNLLVDLVQPTSYGGMEFEIEGDRNEKISYEFSITTADGQQKSITGTTTLEDLASRPHAQQFPESSNRIYLERAPGDDLKFLTNAPSLVFAKGRQIEFSVGVSPFAKFDRDTELQLLLTLRSVLKPKDIAWKTSKTVQELNQVIPCELDAELEAGVYELSMELNEPSQIPFSPAEVLTQRVVQFVVVDDQPIQSFSGADDNFELIYKREEGKQETTPGGLFKNWGKLNSSARKLWKNFSIQSAKSATKHFEIPSGSLQIFPLTLSKKQSLLKLEVEYEHQESLQCDFVLFDRDSPTHAYSELTSDTISLDEQKKDGEYRRHAMVFWNRSANPVLMIRNLKSQSSLKIVRVKVFRFLGNPEDYQLHTNRNRRLFTQFSSQQFSRLLAAPKAIENGSYSLDDWHTFRPAESD